MASCQTWSSTSHYRHPWFDNSVPKRKHPETVSQDEDSHPPTKRLRSTILERGFAHLSLNSSASSSRSSSPPSPPSDSTQDVVLDAAEPMDMDMTYQTPSMSAPSAELPFVIEEPVVPEINMKTSSWYEPEPDRIVITDLDSYTREDEEEERETQAKEVSVNEAFLNHIKSKSLDPTRPKATPPPTASQALVLFKPLALPLSETSNEQTIEPAESKPATVDENAMDIEV